MKTLATILNMVSKRPDYYRADVTVRQYANVLKTSLDKGQAILLDEILKAFGKIKDIEVNAAYQAGRLSTITKKGVLAA